MSLHIFHLTDEGGSGRGDSPRGRRCRTFGPGQHGPGQHAAFEAHPFSGFAAGGGPRGRGRKARRGDIRTAALLLLAEEPRNGYQIMQEVQERSAGVWRPSAGSVYPALQQLVDEGLIRSEEHDGRKLFALTDTGRDFVSERGSERPAPWAQMGGDVGSQARELGKLMREIGFAFAQVIQTGGEGQRAKAHEVLAHARRDLYRILANGDASAEGPGAGPTGSEGDG
jgi:DNA-binding PadR family transcriptional regulator